MEELKSSDLDYFLIRMKRKFEALEGPEEQLTRRDLGIGFTIGLPADLVEASAETAARIFPTLYRPAVILTAKTGNAGMTFQIIKETKDSRAEAFCDEVCCQMKAMDGRNVFYDNGILEAEAGKEVAFAEYKSFASDERVYNLLFVFQTPPGMVMGTFYCVFKDYES